MRNKPFAIVVWIILVIAPVITGFVALKAIPDGITSIPLHWDFEGNINGWGEPKELLTGCYILAGTNLLLAVCYLFTNQAMEVGVVHGVRSPKTARVVLLVAGVFLVLLNVGILALTLKHVLAAL